MQPTRIQEILGQVEKPSRYLGTECNRTLKDPGRVALRMALAFPDLYEIGTSHFGIQILYHLLNRRSDVAVERVYAPAKDMEASLRQEGLPLTSLESQTPLAEFPIVGFSLLYELNFTNVLNMLDLAGIPLYAAQRGAADPLVIGGGPCVSNPEPMALFFDAMVFGDGEEVLPQMVDAWLAWRGGWYRSSCSGATCKACPACCCGPWQPCCSLPGRRWRVEAQRLRAHRSAVSRSMLLAVRRRRGRQSEAAGTLSDHRSPFTAHCSLPTGTSCSWR